MSLSHLLREGWNSFVARACRHIWRQVVLRIEPALPVHLRSREQLVPVPVHRHEQLASCRSCIAPW